MWALSNLNVFVLIFSVAYSGALFPVTLSQILTLFQFIQGILLFVLLSNVILMTRSFEVFFLSCINLHTRRCFSHSQRLCVLCSFFVFSFHTSILSFHFHPPPSSLFHFIVSHSLFWCFIWFLNKCSTIFPVFSLSFAVLIPQPLKAAAFSFSCLKLKSRRNSCFTWNSFVTQLHSSLCQVLCVLCFLLSVCFLYVLEHINSYSSLFFNWCTKGIA